MKFLIEHHSVMLGLICRECEKEYGEEWLEIMSKACIQYALQRGSRMGQRAIANGDERTMVAYKVYNELDTAGDPGVSDYREEQVDPFVNSMYSCAWHTARVEHGLGKYGIAYCPYIDYYLVKGFNPDLEMDCIQTLPEGAECCLHRWNGMVNDEETKAKIKARKAELGSSIKKGMDYHTAHTYFACLDSIAEQKGKEAAEKICKAGLEAFAAEFGREYADRVLEFEGTDFWQI